MMVQARDKGSPPNYAPDMATVQIDVTRNENNPVFASQNYSIVIPETQGVGTTVVTVNATDPDRDVNHIVTKS